MAWKINDLSNCHSKNSFPCFMNCMVQSAGYTSVDQCDGIQLKLTCRKCMHVRNNIITLIKDTPYKGHNRITSIQRTLLWSQMLVFAYHLRPLESGQPLLNGQNWSHCVLYREVPLYSHS